MPDPDKLLRTLRRAIDACRDTPGRKGRVVTLADVDDIFATGDLHGNLANFQAFRKRADLGNHPRRHLVIQEVVHGPNRYSEGGGDKSHQLLDLVAALKSQYPRQVHFLPGNHELGQLTGRAILKGDDNLNELFARGVTTAYGERASDVYAAYMDLIAAAPLMLRTPNRVVLTHSLPSALKFDRFRASDLERDTVPEDMESNGSVHLLVWGRDTRAEHVHRFLETIDADLLITGHIPTDAGFIVPNDRQLILDSVGTPAGFCLFPTTRPLTHAELLQHVGTL
jgi:Calcineurin-like phosphoesterase